MPEVFPAALAAPLGLGLGAGFGVVLDVLVLRVFVRAARDLDARVAGAGAGAASKAPVPDRCASRVLRRDVIAELYGQEHARPGMLNQIAAARSFARARLSCSLARTGVSVGAE